MWKKEHSVRVYAYQSCIKPITGMLSFNPLTVTIEWYFIIKYNVVQTE